MSAPEIWATVAGVLFATLLTRAGFLVLGGRTQLPPAVQAGA